MLEGVSKNVGKISELTKGDRDAEKTATGIKVAVPDAKAFGKAFLGLFLPAKLE